MGFVPWMVVGSAISFQTALSQDRHVSCIGRWKGRGRHGRVGYKRGCDGGCAAARELRQRSEDTRHLLASPACPGVGYLIYAAIAMPTKPRRKGPGLQLRLPVGARRLRRQPTPDTVLVVRGLDLWSGLPGGLLNTVLVAAIGIVLATISDFSSASRACPRTGSWPRRLRPMSR